MLGLCSSRLNTPPRARPREQTAQTLESMQSTGFSFELSGGLVGAGSYTNNSNTLSNYETLDSNNVWYQGLASPYVASECLAALWAPLGPCCDGQPATACAADLQPPNTSQGRIHILPLS